MFACNCCAEPNVYKSRKALYKHERKYDPTFVEKSERLRQQYDLDPVSCRECKAVIAYEKRLDNKFCTHRCAALFNNRKRGRIVKSERPIRIRIPKRKENSSCAFCCNPTSHKNRIYCSLRCASNQRSKLRGEEILKGLGPKGTPASWKKLLIRLRGRQCERCKISEWMGAQTPLEIDHINGNPDEDTLENLRLLCPNCHAQTPTYTSKNIGSGRAWRRKYYHKGMEPGIGIEPT